MEMETLTIINLRLQVLTKDETHLSRQRNTPSISWDLPPHPLALQLVDIPDELAPLQLPSDRNSSDNVKRLMKIYNS
jgi:hypothetical protein